MGSSRISASRRIQAPGTVIGSVLRVLGALRKGTHREIEVAVDDPASCEVRQGRKAQKT